MLDGVGVEEVARPVAIDEARLCRGIWYRRFRFSKKCVHQVVAREVAARPEKDMLQEET